MRSNSLCFLSICGNAFHIFMQKNINVKDKLFLHFEGIFSQNDCMKFTNPYHMISFINDRAIKLVILTIN